MQNLIKSPARVSFIRELYYARMGVPIPNLLPVTKKEIRSDVKEAVATTRDDSEIVDEEIRGVTPELVFDSVRVVGESESAILLDRKERAKLRAEVEAFRQQSQTNAILTDMLN